MARIVPTPIPAPPALPQRSDPAGFQDAADAYYDWQHSTLPDGIDAQAQATFTNAEDAHISAVAADERADDAGQAVVDAQAARDKAEEWAEGVEPAPGSKSAMGWAGEAEGFKDSAWAAAAAAGAGTLPEPLVPGKVLGALAGGGVGWIDALRTGDVIFAPEHPGDGFVEPGAVYLKSAYPDLAAKLGTIPDQPAGVVNMPSDMSGAGIVGRLRNGNPLWVSESEVWVCFTQSSYGPTGSVHVVKSTDRGRSFIPQGSIEIGPMELSPGSWQVSLVCLFYHSVHGVCALITLFNSSSNVRKTGAFRFDGSSWVYRGSPSGINPRLSGLIKFFGSDRLFTSNLGDSSRYLSDNGGLTFYVASAPGVVENSNFQLGFYDPAVGYCLLFIAPPNQNTSIFVLGRPGPTQMYPGQSESAAFDEINKHVILGGPIGSGTVPNAVSKFEIGSSPDRPLKSVGMQWLRGSISSLSTSNGLVAAAGSPFSFGSLDGVRFESEISPTGGRYLWGRTSSSVSPDGSAVIYTENDGVGGTLHYSENTFNYDTDTMFYVPPVLPAAYGFDAYVKA